MRRPMCSLTPGTTIGCSVAPRTDFVSDGVALAAAMDAATAESLNQDAHFTMSTPLHNLHLGSFHIFLLTAAAAEGDRAALAYNKLARILGEPASISGTVKHAHDVVHRLWLTTAAAGEAAEEIT